MAKPTDLMNTWNTIKEVDLRPLRQQALNGVRFAIVGAPGSGRSTLASQMRSDPAKPENESNTPVLVLDLENAPQAGAADMIILMIDSRPGDSSQEQALAGLWANAGKRVLVFINEFEEPQGSASIVSWADWSRRRIVHGSALNDAFLISKFAPAIIELVAGPDLGAGTSFPAFPGAGSPQPDQRHLPLERRLFAQHRSGRDRADFRRTHERDRYVRADQDPGLPGV